MFGFPSKYHKRWSFVACKNKFNSGVCAGSWVRKRIQKTVQLVYYFKFLKEFQILIISILIFSISFFLPFFESFFTAGSWKKDSKNGAARNFFGPSYFDPTLAMNWILLDLKCWLQGSRGETFYVGGKVRYWS